MLGWKPDKLSNLDAARSIAREVAMRVQADAACNATNDTSLASGDLGLAILFGYLDRCFPGERWDEVAHLYLQKANSRIASAEIGLYGGLSGFAFASWYLSRNATRYQRLQGLIEAVLLPQVQAAAASLAGKFGMRVEDFDLVSGLSGVAAYLLCRVQDDRAYNILQTVLESLVIIVNRESEIPAWFTPPELISSRELMEKYPSGVLNCGLAHGLPGMLSVLALAYRDGITVASMRSALRRAAEWLRAQRLPESAGGGWPAAVPVDGEDQPVTHGPIAWCYGSPGVARALWLSATALDDSQLRETAIEAISSICRRLANRRVLASPTFCHGNAGLLQIAMRFAAETALADCRAGAEAALDGLVRSFSSHTKFGYKALDPGTGPVDRPGLLDGAAGISLVLLAAVSDPEPTWDRIFLLS
jgi:lantibiotic modifying enzyme